jgi:polar amino acid transport system substrate-binding protein
MCATLARDHGEGMSGPMEQATRQRRARPGLAGLRFRPAIAATAAAAMLSLVAACSSISSGTSGAAATAGGSATASAAACSNSAIQPDLYAKGQLTVATDSPVYSPWFVNNKPSNGQGYESAVAYAIAAQLGFSKSQVNWVVEPFDSSYAPGPKKFDFDINEISYSPQRATAVTFSDSYYDVQQSLVALKGSAIVTKHTAADLKSYVFGDQIGTTSLAFINTAIQPTQTPKVFNTLNDVAQALGDKQIAAFVTDTPTAQYITSSSEIPNSVLVGQFPSTGEHYGLLFSKGDPLVTCVNKALSTLKANGTLAALQKKYLQIYLTVPTLEP